MSVEAHGGSLVLRLRSSRGSHQLFPFATAQRLQQTFNMDPSTQPPLPAVTNPRFTLELEFVSSLANPYYLSHLAVTYPSLLGISRSDDNDETPSDPDAQAFAAYLAYLYSYWKTPEYSQFLTYPGPTLRALRLLQEDRFRRDIILPQVIERLAGAGMPDDTAQAAEGGAGDDGPEKQDEQGGVKS